MKNVRWAASGVVVAAFVVLAAVLAGCKGFWDLPASTPSNPTTPTKLSSGDFYVLNATTRQIAAFDISSGTLDDLSGSPYLLSPATPACIAIAPGGAFVYVGTNNGIYFYTVGSGGALTSGDTVGPISGDTPSAMVSNGSWLVDAFIQLDSNPTEVVIDAIPISTSTGISTASSANPVETQSFPIANSTVEQMVLSPDGTNLFLALAAGGTIVVPFTSANSNPIGATATPIGLPNSNSQALSVAVDPSSTPRVFYIGETNTNNTSNPAGLFVYDYSTLGTGNTRSAPTQITGSPIASGGLSPNAILPIASGGYVYVANGEGNTAPGNIAWFPITASGTTYTIAAGSSIVAGVQPIGLAEDSGGNFVLAVSTGGSTSSGDPDLEAYTMSSGALTSALQKTTGTDPVGAVAIAALPAQ